MLLTHNPMHLVLYISVLIASMHSDTEPQLLSISLIPWPHTKQEMPSRALILFTVQFAETLNADCALFGIKVLFEVWI